MTKPTVRSAFPSQCSVHARERMCVLIRTPRKRHEALSQKKTTGRLRSDQAWVAERRGENGGGGSVVGLLPSGRSSPWTAAPSSFPSSGAAFVPSLSLHLLFFANAFQILVLIVVYFFFKVYLLMENCHTSNPKVYVLSIYNEPSRLQARKSLCP